MPETDKIYRMFFENSADAMLIIVNGLFIECNTATVVMLGYGCKKEIINSPPFKLSPQFQPDGKLSSHKAEEMMQIARERGSHKFEWDHLRKDGSIIPVEVSLTALEASSGSTLHTVWRDISKRREAEKALQESEHRFHAIFETIPDVIAITRMRDGVVVDINQAYDSLTGFSREQLVGRSSLELDSWVNAGDRERVIEQVREVGFVRNMEVSMRTSDDVVRQALVSANMINLFEEPHLLTVFKDISERARSRAALRESEERFRQVFEANPDPVVIARLDDGKILDVNTAFEQKTGITRLEALGHNSADLNLWVDHQRREPFLTQLKTSGEVNNYEADFRSAGETPKTGLLSARIIRIKNEPCILIVIRDISAEKRAERALIEMDQLKNEFISTAAHELRTPVASIMGYTELLSGREFKGVFSDEQKQDFFQEVHENSERLTKIIDDILDVGRIESGQRIPLRKSVISIEKLLEKIVSRFRLTGRHTIQIQLDPSMSGLIEIDSHRISQVLENIISNAIKYSDKNSTVLVRAKSAGSFIEFSVSDQGIGMNEEQKSRIFDKFYRADGTDTAVRGLGLGMSIVKQIIEEHRGTIAVESTVSEGTTVSFKLPAEAASGKQDTP
ncbi:MAG: hypothetical protein C0614_12255 [Desulfuromonas sp.]|nr:MAG: hypothetical protein C0614_12255 [Desulfuromonas sp.]